MEVGMAVMVFLVWDSWMWCSRCSRSIDCEQEDRMTNEPLGDFRPERAMMLPSNLFRSIRHRVHWEAHVSPDQTWQWLQERWLVWGTLHVYRFETLEWMCQFVQVMMLMVIAICVPSARPWKVQELDTDSYWHVHIDIDDVTDHSIELVNDFDFFFVFHVEGLDPTLCWLKPSDLLRAKSVL